MPMARDGGLGHVWEGVACPGAAWSAGAGYACSARPDLHTVCRSFHKISSALSAKVRGGSRSAKILIQSRGERAAQTSIQTREKSMRAEDRSFGGLLIIEGLDEAAVRAALSRLKATAPQFGADEFAALPLYTMFFGLHRRLLPGG